VLWWISGGLVLIALIVLVWVAVTVVRHLRAFDNVARAMQARLEDGQRRVEPRLQQLQGTVEAMIPQLEAMAAAQEAAAARRSVENS
jgi:hypothetical protein